LGLVPTPKTSFVVAYYMLRLISVCMLIKGQLSLENIFFIFHTPTAFTAV